MAVEPALSMPSGLTSATLAKRSSQRQAQRRNLPARQIPNRTELHSVVSSSSIANEQKEYAAAESSDDEIPVPMKLSALTKALLNDGEGEEASSVPPARPLSSPRTSARGRSAVRTSVSASVGSASTLSSSDKKHPRSSSRQSGGKSPSKPASPAIKERSRETASPMPVRKRVVRLSNTPQTLNQMKPRRSNSLSRLAQRGQVSALLPSISSAQPHPTSSRPSSRDGKPLSGSCSEPQEVITPAQPKRIVRIMIGSSGHNRSSAGSSTALTSSQSGLSFSDREMIPSVVTEDEAVAGANIDPGSVPRHPSTSSRPVGRPEESVGLNSSRHVKRVAKLPGSFLSGPARRGRRRQSEEDTNGENGGAAASASSRGNGATHPLDDFDQAEMGRAHVVDDDSLDVSFFHYSEGGHRDFASGSPVSSKELARAANGRRQGAAAAAAAAATDPRRVVSIPAPRLEQRERKPDVQLYSIPEPRGLPHATKHAATLAAAAVAAVAVNAALLPRLPSPPPSLNECQGGAAMIPLGTTAISAAEVVWEKACANKLQPVPALSLDHDRKPLGAISQNTPNRLALPPPPPKMPSLEPAAVKGGPGVGTRIGAGIGIGTGTGTGTGTGPGQSKQRRNIIRLNGRCLTRLDCLGKGGSAKVYRVTTESGEMYALKRVTLENADEIMIRGYKGEIDLLKRLAEVQRVIHLEDFELNEEKRILTLLMEMGELDLETLLGGPRQSITEAILEPVSLRFYWKEMLECVQAVHQHDIVHSDLKPANFVLVKGRLKLIDFGIANAIQTDHTVNVHRETQVGTPNYMSPESLLDANAAAPRLPGRPKLMKLGKPSDVWSLGCILYRMTYGFPPFAHIANPMARCQAIINHGYTIEFPARAAGGCPVPPSLLRTLRRCLSREPQLRPTCSDLLALDDPFLYPHEPPLGTLPIDEQLLTRLIQSVVSRCREHVPSDAEAGSAWTSAYWASIKKAMLADRTA